MKNKLKYFFVLVLGLFFIPSTFAFELKTFNGDPEEVEVVSSKEYNGTTYYYKRISWGDFFQCIEKTDVINETNSGDYVSSPATPAMTCPNSKVLKYRRRTSNFVRGIRHNWWQFFDWENNYGYYWYNRLEPQFYLVRSWFWGKFFMIQWLKSDKGQSAFMYWQADYRWDWKLTTSIGSSQYAVGFPNMFWVHMYREKWWEVEGSTFFQWKFWLHKILLTNSDQNNLFIIDTHKHLVYDFKKPVIDFVKDNFQYMDLWLMDNCPARMREFHWGAGTDKFYVNGKLLNKEYTMLNTDWRELTEKECATYKKDIKDRMIYNMDYLNFMRGATEGDKDLQNKSLKEYNQCVLYYSSIKTYTTYDRECYKDLLDNNKWIEKWQEIKDRDWEWEWPETDSSVCVSWKKYKAAYKNKYDEKREEFLNLSKENWFAPHGIDIKVYCGEKPKNEGDTAAGILKEFFSSPSNFFQSFRDKFNWNSWEPIWVYSWKNYYQYDFDADYSQLRILYDECQGRHKNIAFLVWEENFEADRKRSCEKYEELKKKMNSIYGNWTGFNNWLNFSGAIKKLESWIKNDDVWMGKRFVKIITDPYYSGFHAVDLVPPLCSSKSESFFEIFFYLFFFGVVIFIFKLFN